MHFRPMIFSTLDGFTRTEPHCESWCTCTDTPDATPAPQVRSTFPPFLICNSFSDSDKLALIIYNEYSYLFTFSIHVNYLQTY